MTYMVILLILLILLAAFFSATETAFTSLSLLQVERLAATKSARGRMVARLTRRPDLLLGTVLIGNNLANVSASALATEITIRTFGNHAVGYMTGILTLVILIVGEVTPKRFAIIYNEWISLHTVRVVTALSYLFRPIIWVVGSVSNLLTRTVGSQRRTGLTLEGLLHMVNLAENLGIVANRETRMVKNIFRFNDLPVQAIMTHRTGVFSLEMSLRVASVLSEVSERGFSRFPVYDGQPEKIEGIVNTRHIVEAVATGRIDTRLKEIMTKPIFVPTTRKIDELFSQLKREDCKMAIVLDEYGGLAGIVTQQDIADEILGELRDENEEIGWNKIKPLAGGAYLMMGDTPIHQVNDFLGTSLPHERYVQTLGGYLAETLDRFPAEHETISVPGALFVIEKVSRNRILSVRCVPQTAEEQQGD